jgi:TPP-dependent pyruvate/acetoin dehydrogenase alpha subunit
MAIPRDRLLSLLESMLLMRRLEEEVCELGPKEIFGNYHVYIGQEGIGAPIIGLLQPDDPIFSTHRNHAHAVARGISLEQILAELMLRETGASRGKGGTQHVMSAERHFVATSIVGGSTIMATGAALAAQVLGETRIGVAFLGDRSLQEGAVAEAFNLASLWELPVLYVCEHNNAVPYEPRTLGSSLRVLADLARTYGLRAEVVDGTDPEAVYEVGEDLVEYVRSERRPAFLEARTPAWPGRASLDTTGRTDLRHAWEPPDPDPLETWRWADPVLRATRLVLAEEVATRDEVLALDGRVAAAVAQARESARAAPFPPAEAAFDHLRSGGDLWPK